MFICFLIWRIYIIQSNYRYDYTILKIRLIHLQTIKSKYMNWKELISNKRLGLEELHSAKKNDRTEFQRDFDRLVFSSPFRRLQNKTQVFPLPGSIFVHNRLTHSLEVSCVGRSLGNGVSLLLIDKYPELKNTHIQEIGAIVSAGCLAHDLGNPPFGHSGEKAIATYFSEGNGKKLKRMLSKDEWNDLINFEGNANSFRLLTHQFHGRRAGGFVLTYSTLASIVKYPYSSFYASKKHKFGFFTTEKDNYLKIARELGIKKISKDNEPLKFARHPLVYLVEAADDICYQMMDIEDACKLKILTYESTKELFLQFFTQERIRHIEKLLNVVTDKNEQIAYLRSVVIGELIEQCIRTFMTHEEEILDGNFNYSLIDKINEPCKSAYINCSKVSFKEIYKSTDVVDIELAGYKIITTLLDVMIGAVNEPEKAYSKLLINRVADQYNILSSNQYERLQAVLDYISGMTDIYALDLYRKINGNSLPDV